MKANPHFESADSWKAAEVSLTFTPVEPKETLGHRLQALRIYVRDHKLRELPPRDRTLEAHFGAFFLSEARKDAAEARRCALEVAYGPNPSGIQIAGRSGRLYELGPEPPPDDIDGRSPSVVVWHDGEMFFLIGSYELPAETLIRVAASFYA